MTVQVTKSAKTLDEGVKNLIEGSKLDYAKWTEKGRAEGSSYYFKYNGPVHLIG